MCVSVAILWFIGWYIQFRAELCLSVFFGAVLVLILGCTNH